MSMRETLIKAKAIITPREKWTQGCIARNANCEPTLASGSDATCYCALGSVAAALDLPVGYSFELSLKGEGSTAFIPQEYVTLLDNAARDVLANREVEFDDDVNVEIVDLNDANFGYELGERDWHALVLEAFDIAIENAPN